MQNQFDERTGTAGFDATASVPRAARDAGLRSYMLKVYNMMASGVLLTGIIALGLAMSGIAQNLFFGNRILGLILMFSPLIMVMVMGFRWQRMSEAGMRTFFWAFAAVMGVSMSVIPLIYSGTSIAQTFFATAVAFASLSLWGYTTKKDLSGWGTFLIMGVVGLIVAIVINLFLQSSALDFAISAIGVLIFAGLTAYDTQKIKSIYHHVAGTDMMGKMVVMGALNLYLDFINMFQFLLSFLGSRE
ncbi:Bax inhibitor-1/YccA family protein [Sphingomicrobium flavum]|uniref:Bax inhibitor-1/YccA family protein n=1 Tax=Sphingomicrobium flavum TaxID=1229164 RepID=UPI0021AD8545|nr:Bax inhibitor-1/YccA family protein [Sphingomicrobium flavum]